MKLSSLVTASTAAALAAGATPGHSAAATYVRSQTVETQRHFQTPVSQSQGRLAAREALLGIYETASRPRLGRARGEPRRPRHLPSGLPRS